MNSVLISSLLRVWIPADSTSFAESERFIARKASPSFDSLRIVRVAKSFGRFEVSIEMGFFKVVEQRLIFEEDFF